MDGLIEVNVVEDLPGVNKVMDVVHVSPPSLKLLLCVQRSRVEVNHRMVHTRLEVKLLYIEDTKN